MVTVRLPEQLKNEIEQLAKTENRSKSDIVKEALRSYIDQVSNRKTPYELGKDLFEVGAMADPDLSTTYKQRLTKFLHEKHSH